MTFGGLLFAVMVLVVAFIFRHRLRSWKSPFDPPPSDRLARGLDGARTHHTDGEVVVEGRYRGERLRLVLPGAVPGTLCRIDCAAPATFRGTIKAGEAGEPPRFVGGPTSTLPDALGSGPAGEALRTLLERCPFVRIRASEVEVLVEDTHAVPAMIDALTGLTRALRGAQPPALLVDLRERAQTSASCPYCHETLGEGESIACAGCGTQHHLECFVEHGRCTVLACGGGHVSRIGERE